MKKIFGLFWTFFGVVITTLAFLAIKEISTGKQENKVETVISAGLTVTLLILLLLIVNSTSYVSMYSPLPVIRTLPLPASRLSTYVQS